MFMGMKNVDFHSGRAGAAGRRRCQGVSGVEGEVDLYRRESSSAAALARLLAVGNQVNSGQQRHCSGAPATPEIAIVGEVTGGKSMI
jgi:hypothetical protein